MMNIVFYLHRYPAMGGIEIVTSVLAKRFAKQGHKVTIISHSGIADASGRLRLSEGVSHFYMPEEKLFSHKNREFLQNKLREVQADLVVFNDSYAEIEKNLFVKGLKVKVVVIEHNSPSEIRYYIPRKMGIVLSICRRLWYHLNRFWHPYHECHRRRFLYAHSWRYALLSASFFGEFRAIADLRDYRKLIVLKNPFTGIVERGVEKIDEIVFVGSLVYRKGCDMLIDICKSLTQQFPKWKITVVGAGPLKQMMKNEFKENKAIKIAGQQDAPSKILARAKIFVFPSRREGWSLVLVEAMANGCVPICFDSFVALHDYIVNDVNGIVVPPFDVDAFIKSTARLMSSKLEWMRLSEEARHIDVNMMDNECFRAWDVLLDQVKENSNG